MKIQSPGMSMENSRKSQLATKIFFIHAKSPQGDGGGRKHRAEKKSLEVPGNASEISGNGERYHEIANRQ